MEQDDYVEATYYFDDIYINNSWARVEIGDDPDYDSCTHREMQIPTAWSSDSVDITVNQGSFQNGTTAYLFVVDEDGAVNTAGYEVSFSAQSSGDLTVAKTETGSSMVKAETGCLFIKGE